MDYRTGIKLDLHMRLSLKFTNNELN